MQVKLRLLVGYVKRQEWKVKYWLPEGDGALPPACHPALRGPAALTLWPTKQTPPHGVHSPLALWSLVTRLNPDAPGDHAQRSGYSVGRAGLGVCI